MQASRVIELTPLRRKTRPKGVKVSTLDMHAQWTVLTGRCDVRHEFNTKNDEPICPKNKRIELLRTLYFIEVASF